MSPTLLLGVCDHSTAAATPELIQTLRVTYEVRLVLTQGSKIFLSAIPKGAVDDEQEWYQWHQVCRTCRSHGKSLNER